VPRTITDAHEEEVAVRTLEEVPEGVTHWSKRELAKRVGISPTSVHRIWRAFGPQPWRTEDFKISPDPLLIDKMRDVIGLYLAPPTNAAVFAVDEKPPGSRSPPCAHHDPLCAMQTREWTSTRRIQNGGYMRGWHRLVDHTVISGRVKTASEFLLAEVRRRAWWSRRFLLSAGAADLAVLAACARVPADELERFVWRVLARPGSWRACAGSSAGSGPDFLPALNRQRDNDQPGRAPSAGARRAGRARRHPGTRRVVGFGRGVGRGHRAGGTLAGR
jgi:hypothetical protein